MTFRLLLVCAALAAPVAAPAQKVDQKPDRPKVAGDEKPKSAVPQ